MTKHSGAKTARVKKPAPTKSALHEWVAARGESYTGIAQKLGVCKSFVSRVLSGQRCPSLDVAEKMAGALGLSLDQFARMRKPGA